MERIQTYIFNESIHAGKMIFLFGPRQVGKTTLALNYLKQRNDESLYWNWDDPKVRKEYARNSHFIDKNLSASVHKLPVVVFDEIHKQPKWKNILKGFYDVYKEQTLFVVTGSARLDFFRRSGDSLVGRYFSYRLLPISLREAVGKIQSEINETDVFDKTNSDAFIKIIASIHSHSRSYQEGFKKLMEYGGFPEPFLKASRSFSLRWKKDYASRLIREDVRDLTRIQDIGGVEHLLLLLPERVGAPLSVNSLREDLNVHHTTVKQWLEALKKVYLIFSIKSWSQQIAGSIKKEEKYYFYDWTFVQDEAARFENLLAVMLVRTISRYNELGLGDFELYYIRTRAGKEVDFLITNHRRPHALIEAKTQETDVPSHATNFSKALNVPYFQVLSKTGELELLEGRRYIVPGWQFLSVVY